MSINNIVSEINEKKKKRCLLGVQPGCASDGDDDVWPLVIAIVVILVSYSK